MLKGVGRNDTNLVVVRASARTFFCYDRLMLPFEPEPKLEPENNAPVNLFTKDQLKAVYITLGCFFISSIGAVLSNVIPGAYVLMFAWFFGVLIGFGLVVGSFFTGIYNMFAGKDKGTLLASSLILALGFFVVGYGTCAFNIFGFQGGL